MAAAIYDLIKEDIIKGEEKARLKTAKTKAEAKVGKTTAPPAEQKEENHEIQE